MITGNTLLRIESKYEEDFTEMKNPITAKGWAKLSKVLRKNSKFTKTLLEADPSKELQLMLNRADLSIWLKDNYRDFYPAINYSIFNNIPEGEHKKVKLQFLNLIAHAQNIVDLKD